MKWIIQSKDRTQYVGKNLLDICENADDARKFNSKFEAEQFLDKHAKTLISGYWKVIPILEEKILKERGRYDYDVIDILSTLSKYANYESDGLDSFKNPIYKVLWHDNVSEHGIQAYAKGMEEIYDIMFYDDCSMLCISKNVSNDIFEESLKEGISAFNKAIAKKYNDTEPNGAGQYYLDWRFDLHDEKDNIEAIADRCGVTVEFQSDEGYFEVFEESKKSAKKNLKESTKWVSDVADELMISFEDILNIFEEYGYGKKEAKNFYDSKWNDVTDAFNEMAELAVLFELEDWTESTKSSKKSLKESTDEDFSLYDLNKHDPFVKEWVKNINKELKDVSIESIGDDEIVFRVWFDETMDLDIFDDTVTDCMPKTLIEFMSDMNIDFGYQFVYEDDKFTENDFVFIRFVAW